METPFADTHVQRPTTSLLPVRRTVDALSRRTPWIAWLVCLPAIAVAEVLTAVVDARLGITIHAVIFLVLLRCGARGTEAEQRLYWALSLAPLLRLLSYGLPLNRFPLVWWYAIVGALMLMAILLAVRAMDYRPAEVGLGWRWPQLPLHLLAGGAGLLLGAAQYVLLWPAPLALALSWSHTWLPVVVMVICSGFVEELLFRGLMQRAASEALGAWSGPLLVVAVATALHAGYLSWPALALTLLANALFALLAARMGTIWGAALAHGLANVSLYLVAPFVVDRAMFAGWLPQ